MCGSQGFLLRANIEGTVLNVCKNCARYGKVVGKVYEPSKKDLKNKKKKREIIEKKEEPEIIQIVVNDYSHRIKKAREKMNLKQEELAQKIAEKESLIHHMESGEFKPSISLAKKLERFLKIKLIEDYEEKRKFKFNKKKQDVTIGDFIKIKKRKK